MIDGLRFLEMLSCAMLVGSCVWVCQQREVRGNIGRALQTICSMIVVCCMLRIGAVLSVFAGAQALDRDSILLMRSIMPALVAIAMLLLAVISNRSGVSRIDHQLE